MEKVAFAEGQFLGVLGVGLVVVKGLDYLESRGTTEVSCGRVVGSLIGRTLERQGKGGLPFSEAE